MTDVLWVLVGIIIGGIGGILSISLVSAGRFEDKEKEIHKQEIFRLTKPNKGKPVPRKKRYYKPKNNPTNNKTK